MLLIYYSYVLRWEINISKQLLFTAFFLDNQARRLINIIYYNVIAIANHNILLYNCNCIFLSNRAVLIGSYESSGYEIWGSTRVSFWTPSVQPIYMFTFGQILQNFNVDYHSYADHTQLYQALSSGPRGAHQEIYHASDSDGESGARRCSDPIEIAP